MTFLQRTKTSGITNKPKIYRDSAINQDTLGMVDLSNRWGYGGSTPTVIDAQVNDLVRGAPAAKFKAAAAFAGNGITLGAGEIIRLGENFRLPSTAKHYGFILWASITRTGYATATGIGYGMVGGIATSAANAQYLIGLVVDRVNGVVQNVRMAADNTAIDLSGPSFATGVPRQYALEVEVIGANKTLRAYVDGTLAGQTTAAFSGALPVPDPATIFPMIGKAAGWTYPAIGKGYGASLFDLSGGLRSFADILAADIASRSGRFS